MDEKIKVFKYSELVNHSCNSLEYINKLINILDIFNIETITKFYTSYRDIKKDVRVNNKSSVSINYCLSRNYSLLEKAEDFFFLQILTDNEDIIQLPDNLELRLVNILNEGMYDGHLYKYVFVYSNKLSINTRSVKYIINNPSFFMSYIDFDIKCIRQILLKNRDIKYKKELINYIETQGCINNIILYNCIILRHYKVLYINNIDMLQLKSVICYNHLMEYINNSKILQRYFISKGDMDAILKFPDLCSAEDLIGRCNEFKEETLIIYLINKQEKKKTEVLKIKNELGEDHCYIKEYCNNNSSNFVDDNSTNNKTKSIENTTNNDLSTLPDTNKLSNKEHSAREISQLLDWMFTKYEFKYIFKALNCILKHYKKDVVNKIQIYLITILEEGFFEDSYFDMIRSLYNKLLKYTGDAKTRKNNDIILIRLSKYCKIFDKEIHIGNVK